MSTTTIKWAVDKNSNPSDVSSVTLQDPTGSFGVIREDTNAVIVASGTPLLKVATGQYQYVLTDPAPGLDYRYYVRAVVDGDTIYYERDTSKPSPDDVDPGLTSRYSSSQCLYDKFGQDNILRWATFSDAETEEVILDRIQNALCYADNYVDDAIRGGPYVLPFSSPIPSTIVDIACTVAGVHLYEARGIEDFEEAGGRLANLQREKMLQLTAIKSGRAQLPSITGHNHLNVVGCED